MNWVVFLHDSSPDPPPQQPFFLFPPPPPPPAAGDGLSLSNRVSPSILLIIVILAIIFFVSGLLHLLVRFLMRPPSRREMDELESVTALQGQLQHLFHLHDAGVDQSFIDTLPVFYYKAIIGIKNPFDCAVCLCEFEAEDKLRLLPKCSHAFHMECIDTWLLSHSTCPLCRSNLLPDFSPNSSCSPIVLVLESGSESSREIAIDREAVGPTDPESGSARIDKAGEAPAKAEGTPAEKVFSVKLGKFKNVDGGGEGSSIITSTTATTTTTGSSANINASSSSNVDSRRCFSMGSFEYVMDETAALQVVPIRTPIKKQSSKSRKPALPLKPGHRAAMSECDCQSRRYLHGLESIKAAAGGIQSHNPHNGNVGGGGIVRKKDSFSISKIWLKGNKGEKPSPGEGCSSSSRRAFSFRFPATRGMDPKADGSKAVAESNNARPSCEFEIGSEADDEARSCNSLDYSQASSYRAPSFTRRTLLWLMGRPTQNKVGHSSSSSLDQV